ncbi:MAG: 3'-5' exonuclease [Pseudonocardiaceae bacterium]
MRILPSVAPTPEQLTILADNKPGFLLIKGAAGSGKTTTALLRLRQLCELWLSRRDRLGLIEPVRVLVLTFNRTLEGYIAELAHQQVAGHVGLQLRVLTFGKWAMDVLGNVDILDHNGAKRLLRPLVTPLPSDPDFLIEEVEYLLSRFSPNSLEAYLTTKRVGRGVSPRVETPLQRRLLEEVVAPYAEIKAKLGVLDWNDIEVAAGEVSDPPRWDVVIIDEAQDFSANQVRTVGRHLTDSFSLTFVMDAAQRIYPRYFTWKEVGVTIAKSKSYTLKKNYRNTRQIAAFARPLVEGLPSDDDGALPDFTACLSSGPVPTVVAGKYSTQIDYILNRLLSSVDFTSESVVFLQPRGGNWFSYLRERLRRDGIPFAELTRAGTWPTGSEAVALCTLHSAKGLEFDHVVMPGLNQEVTPHGAEDGDVHLDVLRRLIAMGVGRARRSVYLGFKPNDPSTVLSLLKSDTFELITL